MATEPTNPTSPSPATTNHGRKTRKTLLVISQTFVPDPASVGQHMADVAFEMAKRGHRVVVYASSKSYEDASVSYPLHEWRNGVEIRRIRWSSFGKKSIPLRVLGTASFMGQVYLRMLLRPKLSGIFFSTSPPLVGLAATIVAKLRGLPTAYWAMDLNPDQLISMGKIKAESFRAKVLEGVNRFILKNTGLIIALDRFMADRLLKRGDYAGKMLVMPPWPHDEGSENIAHSDNPFRREHKLDGKFVVMYSGNHSPANPLKTLLEAAVRLKDHPTLQFMFIGGGLGKKEVEQYKKEHALSNVVSLPYQPMETLKYSLSAADAHVVSLGDNMVGIIHPCKIYGAMSVARPILFLGPKPSHVADLLEAHGIGHHVAHGEVDAAVVALEALVATVPAELTRMGNTARGAMETSLTKEILAGRMCDRIEQVVGRA